MGYLFKDILPFNVAEPLQNLKANYKPKFFIEWTEKNCFGLQFVSLLKRNILQKRMKHKIQGLFFSHVWDQLNQCFIVIRIFLIA